MREAMDFSFLSLQESQAFINLRLWLRRNIRRLSFIDRVTEVRSKAINTSVCFTEKDIPYY